jgi:hypothetical protein
VSTVRELRVDGAILLLGVSLLARFLQEVTIDVINPRETTGHTGRKVDTGATKHHKTAAGHVLGT